MGAKVWVGPIAMAPNLVAFFPFRISVFMIDGGRNHLNTIRITSSRFVFSNLWCTHIGNHPLSKNGYRSERKVENFKNPAIFWWPAGTCSLNVAISEKIPEIWQLCFSQVLCMRCTGFLKLSPSGVNLPKWKTLTSSHQRLRGLLE